MSVGHIQKLLLCVIRVISAYNLSMVLLSVGQHLSLWPAIKTLSPYREKLQSELHQIQGAVNHLFSRSLLFDTSPAFQNML